MDLTSQKEKNFYLHNSTLIYILLISAFGPYILPSIGIRFDHLVIYSIFFFFSGEQEDIYFKKFINSFNAIFVVNYLYNAFF